MYKLSIIIAVAITLGIADSAIVSTSLFATNLSGCDALSKCDPYVVIHFSSFDHDWKECNRTKKIQNENNPVWPDFTYEHKIGTGQRWRFSLWDADLTADKLIATFPILIVDEFKEFKEVVQFETENNRGTLHVLNK